MPLGANVRGFSAMVTWQVAHGPIKAVIKRLELDPAVHRGYAEDLRATLADLQMAGRAYAEWRQAVSAAGSADLPQAPDVSSSNHFPPGLWWSSSETAERLTVSARRVRQLCAQGRLSAVKRGREWFIDPASIEVWLETRNAV